MIAIPTVSLECADRISRRRRLLFWWTKGKSINLLLEINWQTNLPRSSFFFQFRSTRETNLALRDLSNVMGFKHVSYSSFWRTKEKSASKGRNWLEWIK